MTVIQMPAAGALDRHAPADLKLENVSTSPQGTPGTLDHRIFFQDKSLSKVSPWHSIPLYAGGEGGLLNFVCEIPQHTKAKYEVATKEAYNPIKQDEKKGKPRFYAMDIEWNYGMLPQTWEDPTHASDDCGGAWGDCDPVDVVEISGRPLKTGEVVKVKAMAILAMIDEGELDWKVVAINAEDPRAALCNDMNDLEVHFPGELSRIREWFRNYKIPDGKPPNKFELNERFMDREYTMGVIAQTHAFWAGLVMAHRNGTVATCSAKTQEMSVEGAPSFLTTKANHHQAMVPVLPSGKLSHAHPSSNSILDSSKMLESGDTSDDDEEPTKQDGNSTSLRRSLASAFACTSGKSSIYIPSAVYGLSKNIGEGISRALSGRIPALKRKPSRELIMPEASSSSGASSENGEDCEKSLENDEITHHVQASVKA